MQEFLDFRTDLAIEAREMLSKRISHDIPGVEMVTSTDEDVLITRVDVTNHEAEKALGKPKGKYITLEAQGIKENIPVLHEKITRLLADELKIIVDANQHKTVLVVGLGNRHVTPDALGPKAIEKLFVTRHLGDMLTEEIKNDVCLVCAIAPGVLGITGMETAEIIQGVVEKVKPDLIIAIDALAAASSKRINTTIQIANTGIHPGSGVGNKRFGLNEESLGRPVIAIGVPTVIHASTIAMDTINTLKEYAEFARYFKSLEKLSPTEQQVIVRQILPESLGDLMVTPKEIDRLMDDISKIIASAINEVLHPVINEENISQYLKF